MRVRVAVGAMAALVALSGCGLFAGNGHLEVPQGDAVCAPAIPGGEVLFGVPVTNTGSDAVHITDIAATELVDTASARVRVDLEGSALDAMAGAISNPAADPADQAKLDALLARLVEPADAVIEPGATADLIVTLTPTDVGNDATVDAIGITYKEGGWSHTATAHQRITLSASATC